MSSKKQSVKDNKILKCVFILKNIDVDDIEEIYGLTDVVTNISSDYYPENTTKISEIVINRKEQEIFSFFDEAKKNHKCIVTMIDYIIKDKLRSDCKCFWDRNSFDNKPIGCPVTYISNKLSKVYYSEITKDKYIISENITNDRLEKRKNKLEDSRYFIDTDDYYETDGIFCSFNCCLAFLNENKHNPTYNLSYALLSKIYKDIFQEDISRIYPAPSWRLLKEYGGILTIDEYRKTFNKILYTHTGNNIKNISKFRPVGFLYEEKVKF